MGFSGCSRLRFSSVPFGSFWPDEPTKDGVGADSGRLGRRRVCALRGTLPNAAGHVCDLCVRSFRDDGFRAADVSREPARHRSLLRSAAPTALPLRRPGQGQALQSGLCQHSAGLARVRGGGGCFDAPGATIVRRSSAGAGLALRTVRSGCDADRVEPGALPVGAVAEQPCGREAQRASGRF